MNYDAGVFKTTKYLVGDLRKSLEPWIGIYPPVRKISNDTEKKHLAQPSSRIVRGSKGLKANFIVLEGVAGAGKSSFVKRLIKGEKEPYYPELRNFLLEKYRRFFENGLVEQVFVDRGSKLQGKYEETNVILSDEEHIKRANAFLDDMENVVFDPKKLNIADRWFYSTLIYQIQNIQNPRAKNSLKLQAGKLPTPGTLIVLDATCKEAKERKMINFDPETFMKLRVDYQVLTKSVKYRHAF